ncbi:SRPBCC family protein [Dellaglioa sp. BT-FLS60]
MNESLFSTIISIETSKEKVALFLQNPKFLLKWVPDIIQVDPLTDKKFSIHRTDSALNKNEQISVNIENDTIFYQSTGGKLEYTLSFILTSEGTKILVEERLYLSKNSNTHLPLKLLTPIAKHAFNANLQGLKKVLENN